MAIDTDLVPIIVVAIATGPAYANLRRSKRMERWWKPSNGHTPIQTLETLKKQTDRVEERQQRLEQAAELMHTRAERMEKKLNEHGRILRAQQREGEE